MQRGVVRWPFSTAGLCLSVISRKNQTSFARPRWWKPCHCPASPTPYPSKPFPVDFLPCLISQYRSMSRPPETFTASGSAQLDPSIGTWPVSHHPSEQFLTSAARAKRVEANEKWWVGEAVEEVDLKGLSAAKSARNVILLICLFVLVFLSFVFVRAEDGGGGNIQTNEQNDSCLFLSSRLKLTWFHTEVRKWTLFPGKWHAGAA